MKGLLYKDFCNLRQVGKQSLVVLGIFAVWSIFVKNSQLFSMMIPIYCMMLLFTAMSYDEMAGFDKYALTLPVTRKELVKTKYVLLCLLFVAGILAGSLGSIVLRVFLGSQMSLLEEAISAAAVSFLYLLAFEVLLPLVFRYGAEKARLFLAAVFLAAFALLYGGFTVVKMTGVQVSLQLVLGVTCTGIVLVFAGFFISYGLSVRIISNKEW